MHRIRTCSTCSRQAAAVPTPSTEIRGSDRRWSRRRAVASARPSGCALAWLIDRVANARGHGDGVFERGAPGSTASHCNVAPAEHFKALEATGGVMTYSLGSPGYPPVQPGGSYAGGTPSFERDEGEGKLPLYLNIAVVVLGLAVYLLNFGPTFTIGADLGGGAGGRAGDAGTAVIVAVLAALLAALSLLPKAKGYVGVVAARAVLGALLAITETVNTPAGFAIGWAMWPLVGCSVFQAFFPVAA